MRREIKFRAWDQERKRMLYYADDYSYKSSPGNLRFYGAAIHMTGLIMENLGGYDSEGYPKSDWIFPHESSLILMQFTGLRDRQGNEIYEGDIVYSRLNDQQGEVRFEFGQFYVAYIGGGFMCSLAAWAHPQDGDGCVVLGNFYEHMAAIVREATG